MSPIDHVTEDIVEIKDRKINLNSMKNPALRDHIKTAALRYTKVGTENAGATQDICFNWTYYVHRIH